MLVVCAAVIHRGDEVLIAQRKEDSHLAYLWEFPGGKVEECESPEDCIIREIKEELDIDISVNNVFDVIYHSYSNKNIIFIVYDCKYKAGEAKTIDCLDFRWVKPDEFKDYEFAEADAIIAAKLLSQLIKC